MERPRLVVELVPVDSAQWRDVDAMTRLRRGLKFLLRGCGLRCTRVSSTLQLHRLNDDPAEGSPAGPSTNHKGAGDENHEPRS